MTSLSFKDDFVCTNIYQIGDEEESTIILARILATLHGRNIIYLRIRYHTCI